MREAGLRVGLHPYGHDAAVAVVDHTGRDIRAMTYERVTRFKHDPRWPTELVSQEVRDNSRVHFVVSHSSVNATNHRYFERLVRHKLLVKRLKLTSSPLRGSFAWLRNPGALRNWVDLKVLETRLRRQSDWDGFRKFLGKRLSPTRVGVSSVDHHLSHAASAYYFAPAEFKNNALIITLDGQGDGSFSKVFTSAGNLLEERLSSGPDASLPLLFSIATAAIGFTPNSDEGKLEALAAFGESSEGNSVYAILKSSFFLDRDLKISLSSNSAFPFSDISEQWNSVLAFFERAVEATSKEFVAAGVQQFYEDFILSYIEALRDKFGGSNLCLAGGGFANVKLNRRIFESHLFENMYIFPAMGDDGAALGALVAEDAAASRDVDWLRDTQMPYFGDSFRKDEVRRELDRWRGKVEYQDLGDSYHETLAQDLYQNRICAHFKGRMEFGPRALGNRSILANPMNSQVRDDLNLKFKKREWFQPFCPSFLDEEAEILFDDCYLNRHMTVAFTLKEKYVQILPGVCHIDGTARAQFVNTETNLDFSRILTEFKRLSGFGAVINTSFNIHGKAIVRTPEDAIEDFLACEIDALFIEGFRVIRKEL